MFKVLDRVRIVKAFTNEDFPNGFTIWLPEMDSTMGMNGTVNYIYGGDQYWDDGAIVVILDNGESFAYHEKSLELIEE